MRDLGLAIQTMFADLEQRCLDAEFDEAFPASGSFSKKERKGRGYWYFQGYADGHRYSRYVGPADDPGIAARVERFRDLKADFTERRRMVSALKAAGLPAPDAFTGDLVGALGRAGVFRLRGVLVGTLAFQCYAGLLGVRLPAAHLRTGDVDIAQFHSVSISVEDSLPPILDVLRQADDSFREVPHHADARKATAFRNRKGFLVEFLVPNTGKDEHPGKPATMPALGGAAAQPLRFLDFLIHDPIRSVLLHAGGVPVRVPAPERYAVHKLIVAARRRADPNGRSKADKDVAQAGLLIEAMASRHHHDLSDAWIEAWSRGPKWREALADGLSRLPDAQRDRMADAVRRAGGNRPRNAEDIGFPIDGSP
ncbi:nucleotidyltransferase family protein [Azospirillum halopraeferens]|uniref:nucleotidyltransferase family protein n=1 Tax=Azospirillum halopraeferens TaxID=34010 RepID=UPI0003F87B2D|nr:GSU2403 family nucleotidyltransferase fold protein [Azospirillum halopraeferens]